MVKKERRYNGFIIHNEKKKLMVATGALCAVLLIVWAAYVFFRPAAHPPWPWENLPEVERDEIPGHPDPETLSPLPSRPRDRATTTGAAALVAAVWWRTIGGTRPWKSLNGLNSKYNALYSRYMKSGTTTYARRPENERKNSYN